MLCSNPSAAMIAPPGTPGAAIIVTPNIMMNPAREVKVTGSPECHRAGGNLHRATCQMDSGTKGNDKDCDVLPHPVLDRLSQCYRDGGG